MKIDWKQKLTSRKFWAAIAGFATALLVLFNVDQMTIERIVALISAEGVLIAYIFAESNVDTAREESDVIYSISDDKIEVIEDVDSGQDA